MLGVVVITGYESFEATGKTVDGRVKGWVIFVGKDYVEDAIQLRRSQLVELPADEGEADKVALRTL